MRRILAVVLILSGAQAQAQCAGGRIEVTGAPEGRVAQICEIAEGYLPWPETCGLELTRDVRVEVVDEMAPDAAHCLGAYWCEDGRIEILSPDALAATPAAREMFGGLEPDALFAAILTHELTHAAVEQNLEGRDITLSGKEYIAYALQVAGMAQADRSGFLAMQDPPAAVPTDFLNPLVLSMLPDKFAAFAYTHFSEPGHGCAYVERILSGEVVLGDLPEAR